MLFQKVVKLCFRDSQRFLRFNTSIRSLSSQKSLDERILKQFEGVIGDHSKVSIAEAVRKQHGQDEGPDNGLPPDVVLFPSSTSQVSEIMKICNKEKLPVIGYGTGSGLENGISALKGGVCINLSREMSEISNYHPLDFDVTVQPGVTRDSLNHFVKNDGLWFPVDPGAEASICGMCATSASGTNAVRYGTMKENCLNLEVVLPNGEIIQTSGKDVRSKKSSAGYNLTNLFMGSEGSLGLITRSTVRLHPQPGAVAAAIVSFETIQQAVDTVVTVLQCAIPVARIELLDTLAVQSCNAYSKLELAERPTLFLEFHSTSEDELESQAEMVDGLCSENGGTEFQWATKQEDRTRLWTARHKMYYAALGLKPGCRSVTTDVCVPISNLPQIIEETQKDIKEHDIIGPMLGHVGDGNFHTFLLFDPSNSEEYKKCKEISHRMASRALQMGGTCTGEHGVGVGKINLLQQQFGMEAVNVMKSIKSAVDPNGIMNPGKIFA